MTGGIPILGNLQMCSSSYLLILCWDAPGIAPGKPRLATARPIPTMPTMDIAGGNAARRSTSLTVSLSSSWNRGVRAPWEAQGKPSRDVDLMWIPKIILILLLLFDIQLTTIYYMIWWLCVYRYLIKTWYTANYIFDMGMSQNLWLSMNLWEMKWDEHPELTTSYFDVNDWYQGFDPQPNIGGTYAEFHVGEGTRMNPEFTSRIFLLQMFSDTRKNIRYNT